VLGALNEFIAKDIFRTRLYINVIRLFFNTIFGFDDNDKKIDDYKEDIDVNEAALDSLK
jgi:hypothetical protein